MSSIEMKNAKIYETAQRLDALADSIRVRSRVDGKFANFLKDAASEMIANALIGPRRAAAAQRFK